MPSRVLAVLLALLVVAPVVAAARQSTPSSDRKRDDKKDDQVVVSGCLAGTVFTVTDSGEDNPAAPAIGNRYRLTGSKDVMKPLKKLNGRAVEVTGTVKPSTAPGALQTTVGKTTISVGGATSHDPTRPTNPIQDTPVPPELKVKSFRDLDYSCTDKKK